MKSVLDVSVSCFQSYAGRDPKPVNLLKWLQSKKYASQIAALRCTENKKRRDYLKSRLPAISPSGLFKPTRRQENLVRHSGLICIDIDPKGNEGVHNYAHLKEEFFNLKNVAYSGLSASGRGFFLLIPIAQPQKHKAHFLALVRDFKQLGVVIDEAPKNVVSLRGYSYDPNGLFRHDATIYDKQLKSDIPKKKNEWVPSSQSTFIGSTENQIQKVIERIATYRIDITVREADWFRLACALANEFGANGRNYFHQISQFHPEYDPVKTDWKFNHALQSNYHQIRMGTFFQIASSFLSH